MDHIWKKIKQDVEHCEWDNVSGIDEFLKKQVDVMLFRQQMINSSLPYQTVSRNGDIVVGFYLDKQAPKEQTLNITIGGVSIPDIHIKPGNFAYILENTHVFPIISVQYSELHLFGNSYHGLNVIYAFLASPHRKLLAQSTNIMRFRSGMNAISRGNFAYIDDIDNYIIRYPDYNNSYVEIPDIGMNGYTSSLNKRKIIEDISIDRHFKCSKV